LSARWLQHYAQGIDYLAENNEAPRRSFICRGSSPHIDIRRLVDFCIGSDSFLSIFGGFGIARVGGWRDSSAVAAWRAVCGGTKIASSKNSKLSELYAASAIDSQPRNAMTLSR
jgi:hypothetical protein